jgi:hypothetical protein
MSDGKVFNRWLVVVGALVIQVSLGAVYIWSVFQTPLKALFPNWTEAQVTLPAQVVLAAFALAVIFGGRIQDKLGPRIVATAGGLILGAGLILARFTGSFPPGAALVWLIVTFSVLGGIGIGAGYVCPIATCVKWFPDKRGLITGLAVAGFGAGAFFFAPLAKGLITGGKYQILGANLFGLPKLGVFNTFMALGIIFLAAIVLGAQLLRNPPAGYKPAGWNPPQPAAGVAPKVDFTPGEMLNTGLFRGLHRGPAGHHEGIAALAVVCHHPDGPADFRRRLRPHRRGRGNGGLHPRHFQLAGPHHVGQDFRQHGPQGNAGRNVPALRHHHAVAQSPARVPFVPHRHLRRRPVLRRIPRIVPGRDRGLLRHQTLRCELRLDVFGLRRGRHIRSVPCRMADARNCQGPVSRDRRSRRPD